MGSKCVVILSGGQDSTTCLFWAKSAFSEVYAVTFDYGQRHSIEIESAKKVAEMAGVASHEIIDIQGLLKSTSPLTSSAELEQYESFEQMDAVIGDRIEKTFVPMRNALFLTIAANRAVELGALHLVTGVCQEDNANYPDCTIDFIDATQNYIRFALGAGFYISAPLLRASKKQTVQMARRLPGCWEALAYSHTSYDGKYPPTDMNHANVLRAHGFEQAGLPDPLVVRAWKEGLMVLPETSNYEGLHNEVSKG